MMAWIPLIAFAYGLVFGSFANVCIHRLPRDRSVVWPRSACPACGRSIRWFDNVPVLSWVILGGRCRDCKNAISWRYPAVETLVGCWFALAAMRHTGHWLEMAVEALFGWAVMILVWTDFDCQILPDEITVGGLVAALALSPWREGWREALLGAVVGGGGLWAIAGAYQLLRRREGMGLGDVKMLAFLGAVLGWQLVVVTMILASLAGGAVGAALLASGRSTRTTALPFGIFLGLAALAARIWGPWLLRVYGLSLPEAPLGL